MNRRRKVVFATANEGKVRELRALLDGLMIDLVSVAEATGGRSIDVVEDGVTFRDNARKKAIEVAHALDLPAIGDDSGLVVDALDGAPGVYSARYAGEPASDRANVDKLLAELRAHGVEQAVARFVCALAFVDPREPDRVVDAFGSCEGTIAAAPRGEGGFGYDPIFVPLRAQGLVGDTTMAELSPSAKNAISHRGRAVASLVAQLTRWVRGAS